VGIGAEQVAGGPGGGGRIDVEERRQECQVVLGLVDRVGRVPRRGPAESGARL